MNLNVHWKNLTDPKYLGHFSLNGAPSIVLTIKDITSEIVTNEKGEKSQKPIAYFEEKEVNGAVIKPMVLNVTNCNTIETLYGSLPINWIGKKIEVFVAEIKDGRRGVVPALRIKRQIPTVTYCCSVCGTVMEKKAYDATVTKYGVAICSKECLDKKEAEKDGK